MKKGKKYLEAAKLVDRTVQYETAEAVSIVKKTAVAKFDETIEVHIRTGCDGRHADQQIRGAVVLPHGTGKTVKVLVFAKNAKADEALAAGADTYVTGTMSYNTLLDAKAAGLNVIAAGHYYTEVPVMAVVTKTVSAQFDGVEAVVSECPCEILTL